MTTQKGLKRHVRARVASQQARYATRGVCSSTTPGARCPGVARSTLRGGLHPETATVANVLAHLGVTEGVRPSAQRGIHPGRGRRTRGRLHPVGVQGTQGRPHARLPQPMAVPVGVACQHHRRLGLEADVHETGSARAAHREVLDASLEAGQPAIVWVDQPGDGTWAEPRGVVRAPRLPHRRVRPYGRRLSRRRSGCRAPHRSRPRVPRHAPCTDRLVGSIGSSASGRWTIPAPRLASAVRSRAGRPGEPPWRAIGLVLAARLAQVGAAPHRRPQREDWPRVFADGKGLFGTLLDLVELIDAGVGATGGHTAYVRADFLDEAAARRDDARLRRLLGAGARPATSGRTWPAALLPSVDGAVGLVKGGQAPRWAWSWPATRVAGKLGAARRRSGRRANGTPASSRPARA